jgi:hypothetical protein
MTDSAWGEHRAAVDGAKFAIGELQEGLAVCTERAESAMGAVIMSVGQNPNVDSAQQAMNLVAEAKSRVDEIYGMLEQAKEHLDNYAAGF